MRALFAIRCCLLLPLTILLVFSGCADTDVNRRFPIGIYGITDPSDIALARQAGFDTVLLQVPFLPAQNIAKLARKADMNLVVDGSLSTAVNPDDVFAWYIADEPDVNGIPPAKIGALSDEFHGAGRNAPTAVDIGRGSSAQQFAGACDVLMIDWYPVPHLPLNTVGENVRETVTAADKKPVWAVLQAMDWRDYPQRDPGRPRVGRFPTVAELRFMSYDAVIEGARGIFFFTFRSPSGRRLSDDEHSWASVRSVVREIRAMRPIWSGQPGTPLNGLSEGLKGKRWRYRFHDYAIIVNTSDKMTAYPSQFLDTRWRMLFDSRRDVQDVLEATHDGYLVRPNKVVVLESRLTFD